MQTRALEIYKDVNTSDASADEAVPRLYGTKDKKVIIRLTEVLGRSLKVSQSELS